MSVFCVLEWHSLKTISDIVWGYMRFEWIHVTDRNKTKHPLILVVLSEYLSPSMGFEPQPLNTSKFYRSECMSLAIAQLVERRTVVGNWNQRSLGRWFKSASRDGNIFCQFIYWSPYVWVRKWLLPTESYQYNIKRIYQIKRSISRGGFEPPT